MKRWQDTFWYRLPRACGESRVYRRVAVLMAIGIGVPFIAVMAGGRALVAWLAPRALEAIAGDKLGSQIIAGLDPVRRAGLPERIAGILARVLPIMGVGGVVAAIGAGVAVVLLGRFLARTFDQETEAASASNRSWAGEVIVFTAGMLAHLHSIRQSFNTDEASSVIHALSRWWAPFDTRFGWQIHIGGELLASIGVALFGHHDWAARVPAAVASSIGLALVFRWLRRRDLGVAIVTVGVICALPLWAEQAALARGYGLSFLAGALVIPALWDILDDTVESETRTLAALFAGSLLGFLAHFFFVFLALAVVVLLVQKRNAVAGAGMVWTLVGLMPAGLLYLPGLPATLYQSKTVPKLPWTTVPGRFVEALGFDLGSPWQGIVCAILVMAFVGGLLQSNVRWRVVGLLVACVGVPYLMRPVYFYPRFFIHLMPLMFPVAMPFRRLPSGAAVVLAIAIWALPQPWDHLSMADLRGACDAMPPGATAYGERFYVEGQFYLGESAVKFIPLERGIPADARVLLSGHGLVDPTPVYPGFHVVRSFPGRDLEMLVYEAN